MSRTYVTTPIYYVNDVPHLGTAYTTIAADAMRRYHLLRGRRTRMLTGTDEHGLKIERAAKEKGKSPKAFVDDVSERFRAAWRTLQVAPDDFIRTTDARHEQGAAVMWKRIQERSPGDIYLGDYEGWYCVGCEELKTEKELEQPGNVCPIHKQPVERIKEPSYFFRLSAYRERLLELYRARPDFVLPETRRNEVRSFVEGELRDISISRTSFTWGIPVPGDPKHVMWVWMDALTNYWTALQGTPDASMWGDASAEGGASRARDEGDARIVHLMGKDIVRFHAVYWPAFLMSAGLRLPTTVFAHGFLTFGGQKMSKSLRNAVDPLGIAREFGKNMGGAEHAGADVVRYQLMRAISFGQDGDFDLPAMIERYNADLGKNMGNLLARTLGMCASFTGGKVPAEPVDPAFEPEMRRAADAAEAWERFEPHRALAETMALCTAANVYVDRTAPWAEAKKGDTARVGTILRTLLGALEAVSVMISPVLPTKSAEMRAQLGLPDLRTHDGTDLWPSNVGALTAGADLHPRGPLFPTFDADRTSALLAALVPRLDDAAPGPALAAGAALEPGLGVATATPPAPAALPTIDYETFAKVDLRVGIVRASRKVPKKDKLLELQVDVGEDAPRTIIAGLALTFRPEDLEGRKVLVVANLAPRSFGKDLVSHGMLLAGGPSEKLVLATVDERDGPIEPGAKLK